MQLFVKIFNGKIIILNVDINDSIVNIKKIIEFKEGIPIEIQRIIFGCKELYNNKILSDYNVFDECTLDLVLSLNGGSNGDDDVEMHDNEDQDDPLSIVIDNGSGLIKAGLSGNDSPATIFPSVIGTPKDITSSFDRNKLMIHDLIFGQSHQKKKETVYIGNPAKQKRYRLSLRRPIKRGLVSNWDDLETIYHHIYNKLGIFPEEYDVLIADVPTKDKECNIREKLTEMMFETFNSPTFFVINQAVLSLLGCRRTTGIAVSCGYDISYSVPINQGITISNAISTLELGGNDITEYFRETLNQTRGYKFTGNDMNIINDIKEKLGYIALDYDDGLAMTKQSLSGIMTQYELPDGQLINISKERFHCPEILFHTGYIHSEQTGIHELTYNSIMECDPNIQNELFGNIVLSGGSIMFKGFPERMKKEMNKLTSNSCNIVSERYRKYNTWVGGSILASLPTFQEMRITKDEYEDNGSVIIQRKCID